MHRITQTPLFAIDRTGQAGIASLLTAVVLALISAIITLHLNRSVLSETQIIANTQRSDEALLAAEGRLDRALNVFITQTGLTTAAALQTAINDNLVRLCAIPTTFVTNERTFEGKGGAAEACTAPANLNTDFLLIAKGQSIDTNAARYVSTRIGSAGQSTRLSTFAPLTVKGGVGDLTGNATVINNHRNLTIWTGKDIASLSGSFETQININGQNSQISSSKGQGQTNTLGPDVVYNDLNLRNMTPAEFQQNMLGDTALNLRQRADIRIDLGANPAPNVDQILSGSVGGKIISIFNSTGAAVSLNVKQSLGSAAAPVTMIVEGNVKFTGNFDYFGVIYANQADFKGGGHVRGALYSDSIEGPPGKGNFTIEANDAITNLVSEQLMPSRRALRQTWRDW